MTHSGGMEDVFLVLVEGRPGREAAYAEWFAGEHMADMRALPGVGSAHAFRKAEPAPTQLCALYEFGDGPTVLETIGRSKGTPALPHSEDQGRMTWRLFETVLRRPATPLPEDGEVVVDLVEGPRETAKALAPVAEAVLAAGATYARVLRLHPAQPARGSEYGAALISVWPDGATERAAAHLRARASRLTLNLVRTPPPASPDRT